MQNVELHVEYINQYSSECKEGVGLVTAHIICRYLDTLMENNVLKTKAYG
jgi:hypothetical protein